MRYAEFVVPLAKAVQELSATNDGLSAKCAKRQQNKKTTFGNEPANCVYKKMEAKVKKP